MFTQTDLIQLLDEEPFTPFRVGMADGTTYDVAVPELMMVGPAKAMIFYKGDARSARAFDRYATVSLFHIVRVEPAEVAAAT